MIVFHELHSLRTVISLRPRYAETDQMGVVYHANYLIWFHVARDAMLDALGVDVRAAEESGYALPVAESYCRYRASARYGDEVTVSAVPVIEDGQSVSVAKLRVRYQALSAKTQQVFAEGETVNVITDRSGKLLLRLPSCFQPMARRIDAARSRNVTHE